MNSILNRIISLGFAVIALTACTEDDDKPIGDPFSKSEGLTATNWIIEEVYLVDEGNPSKPERNISNFYTSTDARLQMDFNADGTFTVIPGDGLNFFPASGTWAFDDDFAPRQIILTDTEGVETVAPLGGSTRISDSQLKLNFAKRSCDSDEGLKAALGYRLVFNRQS